MFAGRDSVQTERQYDMAMPQKWASPDLVLSCQYHKSIKTAGMIRISEVGSTANIPRIGTGKIHRALLATVPGTRILADRRRTDSTILEKSDQLRGHYYHISAIFPASL